MKRAPITLSSRAEQNCLRSRQFCGVEGPAVCSPLLNPGLVRFLTFLCVLCVLCGESFSLDREAFSIQNYDLTVQIDPAQHRLGARGKITLRNDASTPQKIAVLQISSSLDWRAIRVADKPVQFLAQPYTSDIDHTGALSEAIITLPQAVEPHATVDLDIAYEGIIVLDATRLIRIGTPERTAEHTDWDQIDRDFVAVRGAGYVAWYPIATESANLAEGNEMSEVIGRWRAREVGARMRLHLSALPLSSGSQEIESQEILINRTVCPDQRTEASRVQGAPVECTHQGAGSSPVTFVIADYSVVERPGIEVHASRWKEASGIAFADVADKLAPWIEDWFGAPHEKAIVVDLPDDFAARLENGSLLFTSVANYDKTSQALTLAHQLTHASFFSPRPWIEEGLAHFAQALYLEHEKNHQAALDYMGLHRSAFLALEASATKSEDAARDSLVNTVTEELYRSKAMCVWWMLRDMLGDSALKKAIAAYKPEQDKDPSYMPRLISAQTPRDLEWFFDDWVYRDRGLPDFKVESAFARKTLDNAFVVAVTVDNLGTAGAEVPVIVKFASGEITKRLEVRAKSKATIRVETPSVPTEVVVNDGSVPESDLTNNVFKVATADK